MFESEIKINEDGERIRDINADDVAKSYGVEESSFNVCHRAKINILTETVWVLFLKVLDRERITYLGSAFYDKRLIVINDNHIDTREVMITLGHEVAHFVHYLTKSLFNEIDSSKLSSELFAMLSEIPLAIVYDLMKTLPPDLGVKPA